MRGLNKKMTLTNSFLFNAADQMVNMENRNYILNNNNLDYLEDMTLITIVSISTAFITISLVGI